MLSDSGTLVPLLTSVASAPWHPSHAGAGMLHTKCGGGGGLARGHGVSLFALG